MSRDFKSEPARRCRIEASVTRSETLTLTIEAPLDGPSHGTPSSDPTCAAATAPQQSPPKGHLSSISPHKLLERKPK